MWFIFCVFVFNYFINGVFCAYYFNIGQLSAVFQSASLYRWPNWPLKTCPNLLHSQGALKFATQVSPLFNNYVFSSNMSPGPHEETINISHKKCQPLHNFGVQRPLTYYSTPQLTCCLQETIKGVP